MRRDPKLALLGALACLGGLVLTGVVALLTDAGRVGDTTTLSGLVTLDRGRATAVATWFVELCNPGPYGLFGAMLVGVAVVRRRWRVALAVPVILVGAEVTTQALKPLLATPRTGEWFASHIGTGSWPSGHATAALALALCAVLVSPARWRALVAVLGGLFATAVAVSICVLAWHFPSDVLGGFFMAATWTLAAVAALLRLERPVRREPRPLLWPAELVAGAAGGVGLAVVAARPAAVADYASAHTMAFAALAVIAAVALALAVGVARAARG